MQGLTRPRSVGVLSIGLGHMLEAAAMAYTPAREDHHATTTAAALSPADGNSSPEQCGGSGRLEDVGSIATAKSVLLCLRRPSSRVAADKGDVQEYTWHWGRSSVQRRKRVIQRTMEARPRLLAFLLWPCKGGGGGRGRPPSAAQ
ncbi:hypothetical protein TraAM80_03812 [Trypanosoma rangeli]|uniref:Uncharacterized protein n=1 Tax=Trypanosoma rangeli TaxID=5698 RepID=A0A3R7RM48_TRYRA|nr:uncharacterized protein TraAM80_03812 [Trypanosoma rangeli]RNF06867.1 hypothetical protein TraAM80_03812 [Trypanosoma rangeli]|eukprot:RNF06867.1 hypothetical protein TraAM80_03812 [Trypanosoma rangeli]